MDWLQYFRNWAPKYEREVETYGYDPAKLFEPFMPLVGHRERCLDVGCGTGKGMEVVDHLCREVIGVEPVEKMAKQATAKGFNVLRLKGEEIHHLEGFDLITFFASIDYMDARKAAMACAQALRPDGIVFLTIESDNEERVIDAFTRSGFEVTHRRRKRAYEGQDYVCLLLKQQLNRSGLNSNR